MSDSSRPHGLQPTRLLRPWDFPGKSTGVGCHCLLQILQILKRSYQIKGHNCYLFEQSSFRIQIQKEEQIVCAIAAHRLFVTVGGLSLVAVLGLRVIVASVVVTTP